jgi:hypothetical protein
VRRLRPDAFPRFFIIAPFANIVPFAILALFKFVARTFACLLVVFATQVIASKDSLISDLIVKVAELQQRVQEQQRRQQQQQVQDEEDKERWRWQQQLQQREDEEDKERQRQQQADELLQSKDRFIAELLERIYVSCLCLVMYVLRMIFLLLKLKFNVWCVKFDMWCVTCDCAAAYPNLFAYIHAVVARHCRTLESLQAKQYHEFFILRCPASSPGAAS